MRERILAAMEKAENDHIQRVIDGDEFEISCYGSMFDAALEVMMEPDAELVFAGANVQDNGDGDLHYRKWIAMVSTLKGNRDGE